LYIVVDVYQTYKASPPAVPVFCYSCPISSGDTGGIMRVAEICTSYTVFCAPQTSVDVAAQLMRTHHVGDVVVVDDSSGAPKPTGIVTDRDIVVSVVAQGLDPTVILVGDIMGSQLLTVSLEDDAFDAIELMRAKGVRRLPVVDVAGNLAGIVSVTDLLEFLTREMGTLANISSRQQAHEIHVRP
jgi:CBS domain-containing protein